MSTLNQCLIQAKELLSVVMAPGRRLLIVTESLEVGGTESHLLRILPRLSERGWDVAVYCLSSRGEGAAFLEGAGITVFSPAVTTSRNRPLQYPGNLLLNMLKLYKLLWRWRPEIVHFYLPRPYLVGAPAALAAGTPIKIMSRRSLSHYQEAWPTAARLEKQLHKSMDALVGNSAAVVQDLIAEGAPQQKVKLIYNGIEITNPISRAEARRVLGLDEVTLVGVVVANLIPYKGHRDLLEALAGIAAQMPRPWRILLAGRDDGLWQKLQRFVKESGLVENVRYLGLRSDIPLLLAAADLGLLTSKEEGFSNVVLESMAAGLPMIVTAVGGNPEAVVDEETGLVVPPSNPEAIGAALVRLANDPALRRNLGDAARRRAEKEFSLDRCVTEHAELYDGLLEEVRTRDSRTRVPAAPAKIRTSKRPLMLAYWGRYGALPQFTLELADACQKVGQIERTAISISTTNELFESYRRFGEAIFPLKTYQSAVGILDVAEFIKTRRAFGERLIADGTQGFVSLMSHVWSPLLMPILSKHGIRHTVIVHDADPHQGDRTAWVNRWLLREAAAADHVVTLTHAVAERLIESRRIPEDKITVLFHPDLNYSPLCVPQNRSAPLRVLFFGRILPYKGLDIFVDAIEALREAGVEVHVGVFGAGDLGGERQRLEALGAEVSNVWIDSKKISEILSKHDVVVVSHVQASQSGVIAAAHGAGLPVIATPVGGLTEQILPEITGLLAPGVTGAALATAIKRVADDRSLLQRMSRNILASRTGRSMDRFLNDLTEIALGSGKRRS